MPRKINKSAERRKEKFTEIIIELISFDRWKPNPEWPDYKYDPIQDGHYFFIMAMRENLEKWYIKRHDRKALESILRTVIFRQRHEGWHLQSLKEVNSLISNAADKIMKFTRRAKPIRQYINNEMNYEEAIKTARYGLCVKRKEWDDKYLFVQIFHHKGEKYHFEFLFKVNESNPLGQWTPTEEDISAKDWEITEM